MTTEPPRPDQIQANVAAALSRLRGELAPTAPAPAQASAPAFANAPHGAEPADDAVAAGESSFNAGHSLNAPDPSMALHQGKAGPDIDTPFARMTGIKLTDQPDLLAGIGTTPPPLADLPDPESEAAHRKRRLRNRLLAGGALIVALGAFWIFSGGKSENEPVPVITADSTPEKVKPADEGGLEVPNQDVAILNGENSTAPTQGETVLPAPEQPTTPPVVAEPAPAVPAPAADTAGGTNAIPTNAIPTVPAPAVDAIPTVPAPVDMSATDTAPAAATGEATSAPTQLTPTETAPAATTETPPAAADTAPAAAPSAEAAPTQTASLQPSASGSTRIQLAAVKTQAAAQKEWTRLQKAHPDALGALTLHVEKFSKSSSEVFYRIQAGPLQDKASAKQLCAELKQKNQACIVAN